MMKKSRKLPLARRYLMVVATTVLLSGCQLARHQPVQILEQTGQQHQNALAGLNHWEVKGKFIFKGPQDKFSASLNWSQQDVRSDIRLTTFLGISIMKMINDSHGAQLEADGQNYASSDPQTLLEKTTGITLPVNDMAQWMKGALTIAQRPMAQLDTHNRVKQIQVMDDKQNLWLVDYQQYMPVQRYQLPKTIKLTGNGISITIKISDWELTSD